MKKLLNHMGPVFKQWADQYFESEVANQYEDFKKTNPEESAQIDLKSFEEKLLAYRIYNGHYINSKYFKKDINEIINQAVTSERPELKLSKKLLDFIEEMQDNEWYGLDGLQNAISEAVCFIGTIINQLDEEEIQKAIKHIEALCIIREHLEALRL